MITAKPEPWDDRFVEVEVQCGPWLRTASVPTASFEDNPYRFLYLLTHEDCRIAFSDQEGPAS